MELSAKRQRFGCPHPTRQTTIKPLLTALLTSLISAILLGKLDKITCSLQYKHHHQHHKHQHNRPAEPQIRQIPTLSAPCPPAGCPAPSRALLYKFTTPFRHPSFGNNLLAAIITINIITNNTDQPSPRSTAHLRSTQKAPKTT